MSTHSTFRSLAMLIGIVVAFYTVSTRTCCAQTAQSISPVTNQRTLLNVIKCKEEDWIGDSRIGSFSDDNSMLVTAVANAGSGGASGVVMLWSIREARNVCRWETSGKEVNGYYEGDYPTRVSFLPRSASDFNVYTNCGREALSCAVRWNARKCGQKMIKATPVQYELKNASDPNDHERIYSMLTDSIAIGSTTVPGSGERDYGLYNAFTGQQIAVLVDSITNGYGTTLSSDGRYLLTEPRSVMGRAHRDSVMVITDVSTSKVICEIGLRSNFKVLCGAEKLLAAYDDKSGSTRIFDLRTGRELQNLGADSGYPIAFSQDGSLLATIASRGLCLWSK
jgi:hypothetical protein